jgi:hypothetical protein
MDERDLRQAFRAAFDGSRPTPGAADRAFARVADDEARAYGPGRRLAGAAAVALALLVVATLLIARGALAVPRATVPASQPLARPTAAVAPTPPLPPAAQRPVGANPGPVNHAPASLAAALTDQVVLAGWSGGAQLELTTDAGATWRALYVSGGGRDWSCAPAPYQGGGPAAIAIHGQSWWLVGRAGTSGQLLASSGDAGGTWTTRHP